MRQVKILIDINPGYLSSAIAEALADGWELYGDMVVRNGAFAVLMLRNQEPPIEVTNIDAVAAVDASLFGAN